MYHGTQYGTHWAVYWPRIPPPPHPPPEVPSATFVPVLVMSLIFSPNSPHPPPPPEGKIHHKPLKKFKI